MRTDEIRYEGTDRMVPLSNLKDYQVAKDSTNVLGWKVVGADGEIFGVVKDLIVEPQAMKARYLYVVADRRFFNTSDDQHMLIPIGAAALDKKGKKIFVSFVDSASISRYPVFPGGPITEEYEYDVRETFLQSQHQTMPDTSERARGDFDEAVQRNNGRRISDDFYNNDNYNENRFFNSSWEEDRRGDTTYVARDTDRDNTSYVTRDTDYVEETQPLSNDTYTGEGTPGTVEDSIATIERLEQLRKRGSITDEEFTVLKKRALDL